MSTEQPPVRIRLYVSTNWVGADDEEYIEIPRDEWDDMTPAERRAYLDEEANTFMANCVEYGWIIPDDNDRAATEDGTR
ncbi:hypothetical protein CO540_13160 [Micromonospora sp. WMMA2032]|uniref:DUF7167 family protein n=1 Tax=Micromonospora sp. WMMA2032 TaxID=2039870 RepID=UPI000C05835C|nr:hypothetical protein [Micromonospora sp. WMMA2032]ATO14659.1 hypothetical protein CO540_13160 [Micromonospora sp. WMMA2032]